MRKILVLLALATALSATSALAQGRNTSMLAIAFAQQTGDFYDRLGPDYIGAVSAAEVGLQVEFWHQFSNDYAFAVQGTMGGYSEERESATPGEPEIEISTESVKLRVGGDRIGMIGDRFVWFMGPGLEWWSGSSEVDDTESEGSSRIGLSGRVGGIMKLSDSIGISGQIGNTIGFANAEDDGDEVSWRSSTFHASWGIAFVFGAK